MRFLLSILLQVLHFGYSLLLRIRQCKSPKPLPLRAPRSRIPNHLAVLLVANLSNNTEVVKSALVESVVRVVEWCQITGIKKLTVYEEKDLLSQCEHEIRSALPIQKMENDCNESDEEYQPPTPPLSDCSDSLLDHKLDNFSSVITIRVSEYVTCKRNSLVKQRRASKLDLNVSKSNLVLCLASRANSKPAIASAAAALAQRRGPRPRRSSRMQKFSEFTLTVDELDKVLENENGLSTPDFIIIHRLESSRVPAPPELHGFPPWHIRLTEIYHRQPHNLPIWLCRRESDPLGPIILNEKTFREALDEFASAEMRFGK